MNRKQSYCVKVNWSGEVHTLFTSARNEKHALSLALSKLAHKVGYSTRYVMLNVNDYEVRKC
jgi:hypothetical protein